MVAFSIGVVAGWGLVLFLWIIIGIPVWLALVCGLAVGSVFISVSILRGIASETRRNRDDHDQRKVLGQEDERVAAYHPEFRDRVHVKASSVLRRK